MGTGDISFDNGYRAANAMWVFDSNFWGDRPPTRDGFVAWPPPGYVPYQVVYPRWSISYPEANFSGAVVSMSSNGQLLPVKQETIRNDSGENTLVWIPNGMSDGGNWPKPMQDNTYTVMVGNVIISGSATQFSYQVTVFDPNSIISTPTVSNFTPTSGCAGTSVTITGTNFTGATAVSFGGTAAQSFSVDSATQITAVLGTGATGTISLTTSSGTATSSGTFTFGYPQLQVTTSSLNFGYVPPGSYKDLTLIAKNIGTGTLTGTVSTSLPFSILSGGIYSLGANQTQQIIVRYTAPLQKDLRRVRSFSREEAVLRSSEGDQQDGHTPLADIATWELANCTLERVKPS